MARVSYIEKENAPEDVKKFYDELSAMNIPILHPHKALAHSPQLLRDWWKMMITALTQLDLDPKLRELVLMRVFKVTHCDYCFQEHIRIALQTGVTQEQLDNIENFGSHAAFDEKEKAVLRYAERTAQKNEVDDAEFEDLKKHLSEREIVELTFCIGNWIGIAHTLVPLGLELEPQPQS